MGGWGVVSTGGRGRSSEGRGRGREPSSCKVLQGKMVSRGRKSKKREGTVSVRGKGKRESSPPVLVFVATPHVVKFFAGRKLEAGDSFCGSSVHFRNVLWILGSMTWTLGGLKVGQKASSR